jgi:hypothetical protein
MGSEPLKGPNGWAVSIVTMDVGPGGFAAQDQKSSDVDCATPKWVGPDQALEFARYLHEHFIQKGRLGIASGQGFYSYPNPAFAQPGFL